LCDNIVTGVQTRWKVIVIKAGRATGVVDTSTNSTEMVKERVFIFGHPMKEFNSLPVVLNKFGDGCETQRV
jgi:hypothetical protein